MLLKNVFSENGILCHETPAPDVLDCYAAEERSDVVTVMDVVVDFIDQLIYIENNEVFVEVS